MRFRMLHPAALLVATLLLAGCAPSDPVITPAPESSGTPIFASDEEALAAATEAYGKYLEVSDLVRTEGGQSPERIAEFVTPNGLSSELEGFKNFADQGRSTIGSLKFDHAKLQQFVTEPEGDVTIVMYVCLDASAIQFVDSDGKDVTPPNKPVRQLFEVTMVSSSKNPSTLVLSGSELWSNDSGC